MYHFHLNISHSASTCSKLGWKSKCLGWAFSQKKDKFGQLYECVELGLILEA